MGKSQKNFGGTSIIVEQLIHQELICVHKMQSTTTACLKEW